MRVKNDKYKQDSVVCGEFMGSPHKVYEFDTVVVEDKSGGYVVFVPTLPGCHTQGETIGEALGNAKEAIELYMETLSKEEKTEFLKLKFVGIQRVKAIA